MAFDPERCFEGSVDEVTRSPYRGAGIYAAALFMGLLPLAYLALIVAFCYGLYLYAGFGYRAIQHLDPENQGLAAFLIYLAPLLIGMVLVAFLLKPFVAPKASNHAQIPVSLDEEPALARFCRGMAKSLTAPGADEVILRCDAECAASFPPGLRGCFSRRVRIEIGLTAAAGCDLPRLAGLIAAAWTPMRPTVGRRAHHFIRTVEDWFRRAVFERDAWDRRLERWSRSSGELHPILSLTLLLARLGVGTTRRVMRVYLAFGVAVSRILMRRVVAEADAAGIAVAGRARYLDALREAALLDLSWAELATDQERFTGDRFVDDLPRLCVARRRDHVADEEAALEEVRWRQARRHPAMPRFADRLDTVEQGEPVQGVFRCRGPSAQLFVDFDRRCHEATLVHYREIIDWQGDDDELVPAAEYGDLGALEARAREDGGEFFHDLFSSLHLPPAPAPAEEEPVEGGLAGHRVALDAARGRVATILPAARRDLGELHELDRRLGELEGRRATTDEDEDAVLAEIEAELAATAQAMDDRLEALAPIREAYARRLALVERAADDPAIAPRLDREVAVRGEAAAAALVELDAQLRALLTLRYVAAELAALLGRFEPEQEEDAISERLDVLARRCHVLLAGLHRDLVEVPHPLAPPSAPDHLGRFLVPEVPHPDDWPALAAAAALARERADDLAARCIALVGLRAHRVEAACGLSA